MPAPDSIERFREAMNNMDRVYNLIARADGVSPTEFWLIAYVDEGVTSQSAIAQALGVSRQTLNSACGSLVRRGLVTVTEDAENRRLKRVGLTARGEAFVREHVRALEAIEEGFWSRIPSHQRETFTGLLEDFSTALEQAWKETAHPE